MNPAQNFLTNFIYEIIKFLFIFYIKHYGYFTADKYSEFKPHLPSFRTIRTAKYFRRVLFYFSKNCPKQLTCWNFKNSPKNEILLFSSFIFSTCKRGTKAVRIFNPIIFHMPCLLSKTSLCIWISTDLHVKNQAFL